MRKRFELRSFDTFPEWCIDTQRQLGILSNNTSLEKTGVQLSSWKRWQEGKAIPTLTTLFKMLPILSRITGHCPQDLFDTILDNIPEWKQINKEYKIDKYYGVAK